MTIPTEPIGSIPRPLALLDAIEKAGDDAHPHLSSLYEDAVRDTVEKFEATGSPVVSDGEQRKYHNFWTYCVHGLPNVAPDGFKIPFAAGHTRRMPRLTSGPFRYKRYADSYLEVAQRYAQVPVKQAVISPSALSLLYPAEGIPDYSREAFIDDLLREHEAEVRRCLQRGAHKVQIDFTEGRLAVKIDPTGELLHRFIDLNNLALARFSAAERQKIGVHTCPGGDRDSTHSAEVDYADLLPSLFQLNAGNFYVALAIEKDRRRVLEIIRKYLKPDQRVFVGVIATIDPRIETAAEVCDRVMEAAEYIPIDQLGTTDDCGYSPFCDDRSTTRETAFAKIRARIEGTALAAGKLSKKVMASDEREDQELRSAALLNATSILVARQRAERELVAAKDALERKTEELGQSVARLRATLDSTTNGILVTDRDGIVNDHNARFLALWGVPVEVMARRDRQEIGEAMARQVADPDGFVRRSEEIRLTAPPETFDTIELADGRVFERHSRVQLDAGRNIGRVWSFHDITSHRRAAAELREQREWFRVTLSSIGDAVITTDLECRVTFLNPVAEKMTGWTNNEARGRPLDQVFHIVHEDTRQPVESPIARALEQGDTVALANHTALVSRGGEEIAIEDSAAPIRDETGKVTGAVMVFHDVTARRRADDALRESEARLRVSLETAALGTWELDLQTKTVSLDERCQELFDLRNQPSIGLETFDTVGHPADGAQRRQALHDIVCGDRDRSDLEFRIGSDGRWVKASAKSIRDRAGAVVRVVGAVQEITDIMEARVTTEERRKELERVVTERTASLQHAIEQMEEFSYSVSHDLRAPLRSIQSYAQAVIEDYGAKIGGEGVEYLQRIVNAGDRMDRLTRDVLTYSKITRGHAMVAPLSLDRVVAEIIEQYAPAQRRNGTVTVASPLHSVIAHEPLLVQAISNLLANALKFVAEGVKPCVHLYSERRGADVRLWVEDNGIGISPEYQNRIWGMFERVHPVNKYDGTGIGLAITRKATERMGGSVGVESDGEHGSRFWIQLRAG